MTKRLNPNPWAWLVLGGVLLVISQMRLGLGIVAWLAPVPFLHYLRRTNGWRSRLAFFGATAVGWSLATLKIVTAPVPAIAAAGFAAPLTVLMGLPYLGTSWIRGRLGEGKATLAFPALMVIGEWLMHGLLPFGVWGAAANTQVDQLALLQLSSITGLHGVSFIVYVVAAVAERLVAGGRATARWAALLSATAVVGAIAFGQARLGLASAVATPTRLVAAVGTDSTVGAEPELPTRERLAADEAGLVRRTEAAASAGAELVVWNEAATMVWPDDEDAWQRRLQDLAARLEIDLVAAYVVVLESEPLLYENKFVYILADGTIEHTYLKHEPVPGEPAVRGDGPMPAIQGDHGRVGGAICYDYDFPRLGLANARNDVDIVALPSSDWRGIDPIHTQMAAVRAIEGGTSIVRSTRFGLSAGIDPWGRLRGWNSAFDDTDRILLVRLPQDGVTTVYQTLGDWFPATCLLLSLGLFGFGLGCGEKAE